MLSSYPDRADTLGKQGGHKLTDALSHENIGNRKGTDRMRTEIVYEDKDLLVIHKPAGLATQTARIGQQDVVSELKNYLSSKSGQKGQPYLGIVHRLDQPVEGLLVFAKNRNSAAALSNQLNKQYYAVFCGKPAAAEGELVDYLSKDSATGRAIIVPEGEAADCGAKRAVLHYRIMKTSSTEQGELSLADIEIGTGRFHQIRAQMANAGMALLGDEKYADGATKEISRALGVTSVALCAYSLAVRQPATGKLLHFQIHPATKAFSFFDL